MDNQNLDEEISKYRVSKIEKNSSYKAAIS
jgi:hypothetical protein